MTGKVSASVSWSSQVNVSHTACWKKQRTVGPIKTFNFTSVSSSITLTPFFSEVTTFLIVPMSCNDFKRSLFGVVGRNSSNEADSSPVEPTIARLVSRVGSLNVSSSVTYSRFENLRLSISDQGESALPEKNEVFTISSRLLTQFPNLYYPETKVIWNGLKCL